MAFVSITRLRLRRWWYLPAFVLAALRSMRQAKRSPGLIGVAILRDAKATFWTASIWENEEVMRSFMTSGAHGKIMPSLMRWCDEASVTHWEQEDRVLPSWLECYERMKRGGRTSKVRFPSANHKAMLIPPPLFGVGRELT
ncbi:MAG: DUF3291 domain-containing protein [Rhodomicrobium sp.]